MSKPQTKDLAQAFAVQFADKTGWVPFAYYTDKVTLALSRHYGRPVYGKGRYGYGWDVSADAEVMQRVSQAA